MNDIGQLELDPARVIPTVPPQACSGITRLSLLRYRLDRPVHWIVGPAGDLATTWPLLRSYVASEIRPASVEKPIGASNFAPACTLGPRFAIGMSRRGPTPLFRCHQIAKKTPHQSR